MKKMILLLFVFSLIYPVLSNAEYAPEYFPLSPLNSWTYRVNSVGTSTLTVIPDLADVNGVAAWHLVSSEGGTSESMFLTSDALGVREHREWSPGIPGMVPAMGLTFIPPLKYAEAKTFVGSQVSSFGIVNADVAGYGTFPLNYLASSVVETSETVKVPAGTFTAIRLSINLNISGTILGQPMSESGTQILWGAKGVGIIKQISPNETGGSDTFELTSTNLVYTTPDLFTFTAQTDVDLNTVITSNPITVTGITSPASVNITGGEYRVGTGAWTSAPGSVTNGQTVTVRQTSAATMNIQTTAFLTIGGVSGGFIVSTVTPRVALMPGYLRFVEPTLDATTPPQVVTVTNSGSAPLTISGISLPNITPFNLTENCTGRQIAVGGSCTISVTFRPTAYGIWKGPLTIDSDGAGSPHLEPILGVGGRGGARQEIGIYRDGWYFLDLDGSRSWSSCSEYGGGTDACFTGFGGMPGDIPIIGDWTGSGTKRIGIYRNGWWFLDLDGSRSWSGCPAHGGGTDACFTGFGGEPGDVPIIGDWTGDGIDKIGIYRNGWYFLDLDGSQSWSGCPEYGGGTDACFTGFGGLPGDVPIIGDWNGGGADKIGIYRNGWYFLDLDGSRSWSGCPEYGGGTDACFTGFGGYPGDIPIIGDWTGDGIDKIGIYRNGWYFLDEDGSRSWSSCLEYGGGTDACFTGFGGLPGDVPIVGRW